MKAFVALHLYLTVCAYAHGQPDARGKSPYDYVNPLIGTTNGGENYYLYESKITDLV